MRKKRSKTTDTRVPADEVLPQYDFSRSRPNPYAAKYVSGGTVVVIDPDLSAMFPTAASVNRALRVIASAAKVATAKKVSARSR